MWYIFLNRKDDQYEQYNLISWVKRRNNVDLKPSQISNDKILVLKDMDWTYFVLYNDGKYLNQIITEQTKL